jgi:hypothetical protein
VGISVCVRSGSSAPPTRSSLKVSSWFRHWISGLPQLSYLEIGRAMDKVLAGVANMGDELAAIGWLFGISAVLGVLAVVAFVSRDPVK